MGLRKFFAYMYDTVAKTMKIGDTSGNNYTEFESDGTLRFNGNATVFEDEYASYFFAESGAAAPDVVTLSGNNKAYGFDGGTTKEILHCFIELPHKYKEGSDIELHIHYLRKASGTGDVKWFADYSICPLAGALVPSQTVSVVKTVGAVDYCEVATIAIIPGTGRKISDVIALRIYRDPADAQDTFGADVLMTSFGIHYEVDTIGSRQMYVK